MRRTRNPFVIFGALLAAALLYGPVVMVVVNAFNANPGLTGWGGATLHWFQDAVNDPLVVDAAKSSLLIAVISSIGSIVIGVSAALYWRGSGSRRQAVLDASTYLRIALPETVTALALFLLFTRLDVTLGLWTVVIGHIVFNSAYATIILQARLAGANEDLEAAAADLGASPWRAFWRVSLPVLRPALVSASLLSFALSLDNVVTSVFLSGSGTQTLPMVVLGLIRYNTSPVVNAIGVLMTVLMLSLMAAGLAAYGARKSFSALSGPGKEDS